MRRFSETLLEHARYPHNAARMAEPTAVGRSTLRGRPPYTTIYLKTEGTTVVEAMFETFGCGVSVAAGSVLTELVEGRSFAECRQISRETIIRELGGIPLEKQFCADLVILALHDALANIPNPIPQDAEPIR
jgi:NifU-like protein involved in Fe-S cluster formation